MTFEQFEQEVKKLVNVYDFSYNRFQLRHISYSRRKRFLQLLRQGKAITGAVIDLNDEEIKEGCEGKLFIEDFFETIKDGLRQIFKGIR